MFSQAVRDWIKIDSRTLNTQAEYYAECAQVLCVHIIMSRTWLLQDRQAYLGLFLIQNRLCALEFSRGLAQLDLGDREVGLEREDLGE